MNQTKEQEEKWYAVVTKYRNEKMIAKKLQAIGIEAFVPLIERVKQYASRKKVHYLPLVSCYVFVKVAPKTFVKVLEITNVFHFVKFGDEIAEITESEISLLKRITEVDYPIEVSEPSIFHQGDHVEIIEGPLAGIKGTLVRNQNKNKFLVEFDKLEKTIAIEVEDRLLRRLD